MMKPYLHKSESYINYKDAPRSSYRQYRAFFGTDLYLTRVEKLYFQESQLKFTIKFQLKQV